jgi:hypothetical protein
MVVIKDDVLKLPPSSGIIGLKLFESSRACDLNENIEQQRREDTVVLNVFLCAFASLLFNLLAAAVFSCIASGGCWTISPAMEFAVPHGKTA